jgi:DNA-binding NarL/FixJ family response regulator
MSRRVTVHPDAVEPPATSAGNVDSTSRSKGEPAPRIKVLLVDGNPLIGEALTAALRAEPVIEMLEVLDDAFAAERYIRGACPDVVILNCLFRGIRVAQSTSRLRATLPGLKVLVLTTLVDDDTLAACIRAGASGYLTKDCTIAELIDGIKRAHRGEALFSPDALVSLLSRPKRHEITCTLTPREQEVLQAMADGLTVVETARQMAIAADTVRTHIKNSIGKLGARSRLEAVMLGLRTGIVELRNVDVSPGQGASRSRARQLVH